jgi:hypothetical protein
MGWHGEPVLGWVWPAARDEEHSQQTNPAKFDCCHTRQVSFYVENMLSFLIRVILFVAIERREEGVNFDLFLSMYLIKNHLHCIPTRPLFLWPLSISLLYTDIGVLICHNIWDIHILVQTFLQNQRVPADATLVGVDWLRNFPLSFRFWDSVPLLFSSLPHSIYPCQLQIDIEEFALTPDMCRGFYSIWFEIKSQNRKIRSTCSLQMDSKLGDNTGAGQHDTVSNY